MISNHNLLDDDISNNNDRNKQLVPRISDYSILENNNKNSIMNYELELFQYIDPYMAGLNCFHSLKTIGYGPYDMTPYDII